MRNERLSKQNKCQLSLMFFYEHKNNSVSLPMNTMNMHANGCAERYSIPASCVVSSKKKLRTLKCQVGLGTYGVYFGYDTYGNLVWKCVDKFKISVVHHRTVCLQSCKYKSNSTNQRRFRVILLFLTSRFRVNIAKNKHPLPNA